VFDGYVINTADLRVHHDPEVVGVFEPVSAIVFLNVDDARFEAWRGTDPEQRPRWAAQLTEAFLHEAYHCFQTYATGFMYDQFSQLWRIYMGQYTLRRVLAIVAPRLLRDVAVQAAPLLDAWMTAEARLRLRQARVLRAELRSYERVHRRSRRHGQRSLAGAVMPTLFPSVERVQAPGYVRGPHGLSARDVVEGAAFSFGKDAARAAAREEPLPDAQAGFDAEGPYVRLREVTEADCPGASPALLRAASALALRYERPGEAYRPMLARLAGAAPGEEVAAARAAAANLPSLPAAGTLLGTAADIWRRLGTRSLYEEPLRSISGDGWPIDELDLLIDVDAMESIPPGELGFGIVTLDGPRGFKDETMGVRMIIGASMLPNGPSVAGLRRKLLGSIELT
jgi:hypothetical protein